MEASAMTFSNEIKELGLERYVLELETNGLTVVPPEVTGVTPEIMDRCTDVLLARFTEMTGGCPISLEEGPMGKLVWPQLGGHDVVSDDDPDPTQLVVQLLLQLDRCFRDLALNPVVDALADQLIGRFAGIEDVKARRLSSTNAFIKWQGEYGYGPTLALHADQGGTPEPWPRTALIANASWCLTDYTKEGGALAYVPGSHKLGTNPDPAAAAERAVAVEAPRGSVLVWHGATWHGAYPKLTPGLRLTAVTYFRHATVQQQENLTVSMRDEPWDDCNDPDRMRELLGFDDITPWLEQSTAVPRLENS